MQMNSSGRAVDLFSAKTFEEVEKISHIGSTYSNSDKLKV